MRDIFIYLENSENTKKKNVAIYGTGRIGYQLAQSIKSSKDLNIVAFIDDENLYGRRIMGIQVYNHENFLKIRKNVDQIFLAISFKSNMERKSIIKKVKQFNLPILPIPSIDDFLKIKTLSNSLLQISSDEFLNRDIIDPNQNLLIKGIKGKSICITGAGGSIGSELTKQISQLYPKKLTLIDNNELNLYKIEKELKDSKLDLKIVLLDITNKKYLKNTLLENEVDTVFHAAAYKHVPLVESNPIEGIRNNVFSTLNICQIAEEIRIKKVIFISSDKAVRPTNIMGATKRLGELIVQIYGSIENSKFDPDKKRTPICYSMVRFGNVVGSSGSVFPLFKEQIENGGPVTVTDKKIVRYFMSIKEACHLVIQASELAKGSDVFLIDMGDPINIFNLAQQMIINSGNTIKNKENPNGNIEIKISGLRPGEKLFEELLIDENARPTSHPKIFKAYEKMISKEKLFDLLPRLRSYINDNEIEKALNVLADLVEDWERAKKQKN